MRNSWEITYHREQLNHQQLFTTLQAGQCFIAESQMFIHKQCRALPAASSYFLASKVALQCKWLSANAYTRTDWSFTKSTFISPCKQSDTYIQSVKHLPLTKQCLTLGIFLPSCKQIGIPIHADEHQSFDVNSWSFTVGNFILPCKQSSNPIQTVWHHLRQNEV